MEILELKYGFVNPCQLKIPPKCSWFFQSLCKNLGNIKSNLNMIDINPNSTSVLRDPWLFETPICLKATFVNMSLFEKNMQINDFLCEGN